MSFPKFWSHLSSKFQCHPFYKKRTFFFFQNLHWIWESQMWHIAKSIWNGSLDFMVVWISTSDCNIIPISWQVSNLWMRVRKNIGTFIRPMPSRPLSEIWTLVSSIPSMSCPSTTWESPISPSNLSLSQLQVRKIPNFWDLVIKVH